MSVDNMNPGGGTVGTITPIPPVARTLRWQPTADTVASLPSADGVNVVAGDLAYVTGTARVYRLTGVSTWTPVTLPLALGTPTAPLALASDGRTLSMPAATAAQDGFMTAAFVAQLNQAASGVSVNAGAISALQSRVTTDEGAIQANQAAINALKDRATVDEADISALKMRATLTALKATGPLAYDTASYTLSIPAASATQDGYMPKGLAAQVASDATSVATLLARPQLSALTAAGPLVLSGSYVLSLPPASASADGYMTKAAYAQVTTNTADVAAIKAKTDVLAPSGAIRVSKDVSVTALAVGALGTYAVNVPGALPGMVASLGPPAALVANLSSWSAAVTAKDTVTIKFVASVAVLAGTQTFTLLLQ